ncbi:MAG: hypothetical protein ABI315_07030 [Bacteroidia bacterium]
MTNNQSLAKWQTDCIDKLIESNCAKLLLIIKNNNPSKRCVPKYQKIISKNFFYTLWNRFLLKISGEIRTSFENQFKNIPILNCITTFTTKYAEHFNVKDLNEISNYKLDFILRFGFNIIKGDILTLPKYGVWSYHHGDEMKFRGGPAGFWEIYFNVPTTGVILQRLTEKLDAGIIIEKRIYKTINYSYSELKNKLLLANTDMPLVAVKKILTTGFNPLTISSTEAKIFTFPTNWQMMRFCFRLFKARLYFYFNSYFLAEQYGLALINNVSNSYIIPKNRFINKQLLHPKKNIFYADGFLFSNENKNYCVCEKYDYTNEKGSLVLIEIDESFKKETILLESSSHHSYPYTFKHDGNIYIIPETAANNCLKLYQLNKDNTLALISIIIENFAAIDSSIIYYDDYFWLFCGNKNDYPNEKLFLFYSKTLTGSYVPHIQNPIKVNPAGSRNAGNIIIENGAIIRPGQYSVNFYGEKIILNKVDKLTPSSYSESYESEISSETLQKNWKGIHTISTTKSLLLIDFKYHTFIWKSFIAKLKRKIK